MLEKNFTRIPYRNNTEGESTRIKIISEEEFSGGEFGDIFSAVVNIDNKSKKYIFIIKKFKDSSGVYTPFSTVKIAEERAENAFRNYKIAKEAGLKVFSTYRLGDDKKSILMTNGNTTEWICLGTNERSPSLETYGITKMSEIPNFHLLIQYMISEIKKATENGILLYKDCYIFFLNKKTGEVDFVLGDLDQLSKNEMSKDKLFENNIEYGLEALKVFLSRNVEENKAYSYKNELLKVNSKSIYIL